MKNNYKVSFLALMLFATRPTIAREVFSKLLNKRLNEITVLSAHNATTNTSKGPNIVADQSMTLDHLLAAGVRGLKVPIAIGLDVKPNIDPGGLRPFRLPRPPSVSLNTTREAMVTHSLSPHDIRTKLDGVYDFLMKDVPDPLGVIKKVGKTAWDAFLKNFDPTELTQFSWHIDPTSMTLTEFLEKLKTFLDNNENEILIVTPNINFVKLSDVYQKRDYALVYEAFEKSRIINYLFTPEPDKPWPTIGEIIKSGKRLIFMFQSAHLYYPDSVKHFGSGHALSKIIETSKLALETQHSYHTPAELETKECCVFGNACRHFKEPKTPILGMQHFITRSSDLAGNQQDATIVNKPAIIWKHIEKCTKATGILPNIILLDFLTKESINEIFEKVLEPINADREKWRKEYLPPKTPKKDAPCYRCPAG